MLKFVTIISIIISVAIGSGFRINNDTTVASAINSTAHGETDKAVDFLIRIFAELDDSKVPSYLNDLIINQPSKSNISTDDILSLYAIKSLKLDEFQKVLRSFNITPSKIFSLEGFEGFLNELQLDFKTVYKNVIDDINVEPSDQLTFLDVLGVDSMTFSFALQFTGDPYAEFKKGNLSNESFSTAIKSINRTTDEVFNSCRNVFIKEIVKNSPEQNLVLLKKYGIDGKGLLNLWNSTTVDPHRVAVFENLLDNLIDEIDKYSPLGILISNQSLVTNKRIVDLFQYKPIKIIAFQFFDSSISSVLSISNSSMPYMMILTVESTLSEERSYATINTTLENLVNCSFVSVDSNNTIIKESISNVQVIGKELNFNSTLFSTSVPIGSPLICSGEVYGLSKNVSSGVVVLETFVNGGFPDNNIPDGNKPDGNKPDHKPDDNKPNDDTTNGSWIPSLFGNSLIVYVIYISLYLL